jgi:siroheme synthase (precorrin-2 oxidase/ferrochelatase)
MPSFTDIKLCSVYLALPFSPPIRFSVSTPVAAPALSAAAQQRLRDDVRNFIAVYSDHEVRIDRERRREREREREREKERKRERERKRETKPQRRRE